MENQEFALRMQSDMIHDIEVSQPKFVVFVDTLSWYWNPGWRASEPHMRILMWIRGYLDTHYDLTAEVSIEGSLANLWGAPCRYYIFKRK